MTFFVYPGFVLLDLSGPLEVLSVAEQISPGSYSLEVVSMSGGSIESASGLKVFTEPASHCVADTFIVVGSPRPPIRNLRAGSLEFIHSASKGARRTASICTGAFLLAACGMLDHRRATTHWRYAAKLKAMYPSVQIEEDRIFVNDDDVWTSAGMTSGIDMTLALVEEDIGKEIARSVARMLVVYYRRPGGQRQFSSLLDMDPDSDRIRRALSFAREHLRDDLSVERLASVAHLSVRQFSRAFSQSTGLTPAKAVERLRVETARSQVEDGRETFESIAQNVGFQDPERMRESFVRVLGQTPQDLRRQSRSVTELKPRTPTARLRGLRTSV
ncbi:MAG: GlxA family transcriptional regulator [Hyphomicrobiaceae bacterium]